MSLKHAWLFALCIHLSYAKVTQLPPTFTIMLDPAGDAQHVGRIIEDSFERGITLQFVEELQTRITQTFPTVRVVLTRFPGETLQPLQNANFANRLDTDLYISIHCYPETSPKPHLYIYYYSHNDTPLVQPSPYAFYPYDKAHLLNMHTTKAWGRIMEEVLCTKEYEQLFIFSGLHGLPFTPLVGIKKPALALEVGLKHKHNWKQFIEPIIASITPIIEQHES